MKRRGGKGERGEVKRRGERRGREKGGEEKSENERKKKATRSRDDRGTISNFKRSGTPLIVAYIPYCITNSPHLLLYDRPLSLPGVWA